MAYLAAACQGLLTVVFLAAAAGKLRGGQALRAAASSLSDLDLVRREHALGVAAALAAAEAAVAALVAVPATRAVGFAASAALLAVLATGVAVVLARGTARPCHCFGGTSTTLSTRHLVRNLALLTAALAGATSGESGYPPGALLALGTGALLGLLVTVGDDLVVLFRRSTDGVPRRGHGPGRPAGHRQPAADRRRGAPAA